MTQPGELLYDLYSILQYGYFKFQHIHNFVWKYEFKLETEKRKLMADCLCIDGQTGKFSLASYFSKRFSLLVRDDKSNHSPDPNDQTCIKIWRGEKVMQAVWRILRPKYIMHSQQHLLSNRNVSLVDQLCNDNRTHMY